MKALTAGFDATSRHLALVLFSVVLDIFLWLGPSLRITRVFSSALDQLQSIPDMGPPGLFQELQIITKEINFFSMLRTYPVGVPSLMASRLTADTPAGPVVGWEVPSSLHVLGLWLLLTLAGIIAGTLFFSLVAQSAIDGKISIRVALNRLPKSSLNICLLGITCLLIFLAAMMPFSCMVAVLVTGSGISQLGYLLILIFAGFFVWMLAPLVFSPHGIILNQVNVWASILRGFYLTRITLPSTSLLFLIFLLLSEGLDVLWNIPESTSWLLLLGIIGHAFITTSLLAASFIYYRDVDVWVGEIVKGVKITSA